MIQAYPGAAHDSKLDFIILKCQLYAIHGGISKDNVINDYWQHHNVQNPVFLNILCQSGSETLFLFHTNTLLPGFL